MSDSTPPKRGAPVGNTNAQRDDTFDSRITISVDGVQKERWRIAGKALNDPSTPGVHTPIAHYIRQVCDRCARMKPAELRRFLAE